MSKIWLPFWEIWRQQNFDLRLTDLYDKSFHLISIFDKNVNATSQNIWAHCVLQTATTVLCKSDSMGQKFFNEWHPNSMVISKDRSEWQPKVQRPTWWRVNWKWSAEALNDFSSIIDHIEINFKNQSSQNESKNAKSSKTYVVEGKLMKVICWGIKWFIKWFFID